jgi:hypothetical protein
MGQVVAPPPLDLGEVLGMLDKPQAHVDRVHADDIVEPVGDRRRLFWNRADMAALDRIGRSTSRTARRRERGWR